MDAFTIIGWLELTAAIGVGIFLGAILTRWL